MTEATLPLTPTEEPTQPHTADVSLIRAAVFGAFVPSLLATTAYMLLQAASGGRPLTLSSFEIQLLLLVSTLCAPFGIVFAVLCGILARMWLRRGVRLASVQTRVGLVGAICGLATLWSVGMLLFGSRGVFPIPEWPLSFWWAALAVGIGCGQLLPRMTCIPRSSVALAKE